MIISLVNIQLYLTSGLALVNFVVILFYVYNETYCQMNVT